MDVYTIQMMMSKVSPHCDVQKVKKVAFAPGSCPLRVLDLGGFPFVSFRFVREGPSNRSTTHPRACALVPVHCLVDMIMRMIMGSLCQSTVYLLGGEFFSFFARLPIIVHEQRPPSFSTPLLVRRAFLVARSREREGGRSRLN